MLRELHEWKDDTFYEPLQFDFTRIKNTLDPSVLPSEKLDEFDLAQRLLSERIIQAQTTHSSYQFIQNAHPFISRSR